MPQLTATLLPHQQTALEWCLNRERDGCILADDMGLGKTVTSCSLLVSNFVRTIIIVPLALLHQWVSEIEKHTTGISAVIYHGPLKTRAQIKVEDYDVTITTTHTILGDFKKGLMEMYSSYDRVIIDEAHKLKNSKTNCHMVLSTIFKRTPHKLLLTGTPICNNINDLISLFVMLNKAPYNSEDYWKGRGLVEKVEEVQDIKKEFLLHRTKDAILKDTLPVLTMQTVKIPLQKKSQKVAYKKVTETEHECKLLKILRMRQCLNDIGLCPDDIGLCPDTDIWEICEKVEKILEIIEKIPATDKVVIFSQWTSMLDIVAKMVGQPYLMYTGKCTLEEKKAILKEFNDKEDTSRRLLFITLKCGGCGLNLNIANHAIIIEPYFNHAEERQAIDRVYRIGQKKDVFIYKLRITSSIENWMRQLQCSKQSLANMILKDIGTSDDIVENIEKTRKVFEYYVDGVGEEIDI